MSVLHDARRKLRQLLPDYSSLELPWIDFGDGKAGELHRTALAVLRDYDRTMAPRSLPVRIGRRAGGLLWPANATLRSIVIWARLGRAAEREFGVGVAAQLAGLLWATHRHNIAPRAFYKYHLFQPENRARVTQFLQEHETGIVNHRIRRRHETTAHQIDHKYEFWKFCVANDLPVIPVLGYGEPSRPAEWHVDVLPRADLIFKRTRYCSGEGFECWLHDRTRDVWSHDHQQLGAAALRDYFTDQMSRDDAIVQPRVSNHPALRSLSPRALSAIRVVSALDQDGEPFIAAASMRAGVGDALLDNVGSGGMATSVDPRSGQVGSRCVMADIGSGWAHRHPDTGAVFGEATLPLWSQVRAACLRAHRCIGDLPTVGWDIAITAGGPMFVEGNTLWSADLIQLGAPLPPELLRTLHRALCEPKLASHGPP